MLSGRQPEQQPDGSDDDQLYGLDPQHRQRLGGQEPGARQRVVPRNLMASPRRSEPGREIARAVKALDITASAMMLGTNRSTRASRPVTPTTRSR